MFHLTVSELLKNIVNQHLDANIAEIVALLELCNISPDFKIENIIQQEDVQSLFEKMDVYINQNKENDRMIQHVLTSVVVAEFLSENAAAAPVAPKGKKFTTWGALKSSR